MPDGDPISVPRWLCKVTPTPYAKRGGVAKGTMEGFSRGQTRIDPFPRHDAMRDRRRTYMSAAQLGANSVKSFRPFARRRRSARGAHDNSAAHNNRATARPRAIRAHATPRRVCRRRRGCVLVCPARRGGVEMVSRAMGERRRALVARRSAIDQRDARGVGSLSSRDGTQHLEEHVDITSHHITLHYITLQNITPRGAHGGFRGPST